MTTPPPSPSPAAATEAAPPTPEPAPTANVTSLRDYLLDLLRQPPNPMLPARDLTRQLRCALGLLKILELADIETRILDLERKADELYRQPSPHPGA